MITEEQDMRILILLLLHFFCLAPACLLAQEGEGDKIFHIQAWDLSDNGLVINKGDPCAAFLSELLGPEKYVLLDTTGVQGPPGVVYTLLNNKGDIAILKCGTSGCASGEEGGHEPRE
jgi:hypothetical protein